MSQGLKKVEVQWSTIAEDLNKTLEVYFDANQKCVRYQCRNLLEKHKKKMRRGKGDSGSYEKDTERDNLW